MILVDTSIRVEHLGSGNRHLQSALEKGEVIGRSLHPEPGGIGVDHRVIGAVHLNDRELSGIIPQPRFSILSGRGIEFTSFDKGFLGPGTGSNQYFTHRSLLQMILPSGGFVQQIKAGKDPAPAIYQESRGRHPSHPYPKEKGEIRRKA